MRLTTLPWFQSFIILQITQQHVLLSNASSVFPDLVLFGKLGVGKKVGCRKFGSEFSTAPVLAGISFDFNNQWLR